MFSDVRCGACPRFLDLSQSKFEAEKDNFAVVSISSNCWLASIVFVLKLILEGCSRKTIVTVVTVRTVVTVVAVVTQAFVVLNITTSDSSKV